MQAFPEGDLLKDLDGKVIPDTVDKGTRFANYIIDLILAVIFYFVVIFTLSLVATLIFPSFATWVLYNSRSLELLTNVAAYAILPFYYVLTEGFFKGRTVGKMITGTVAIRKDGEPLTWKNVFGRSFSRIVPFEQFSGFSEPWHDQWTKTTVVKKNQLIKY